MSAIQTPVPVPATIPAAVAKTFGDDVAKLVARILPVTLPDLDTIKPSDIKMSDSAARAAMRAKLDKGEAAHAFVQGFVYLAVRMAWGSITVDAACEGQTKYGEHALRTFRTSLTGTKGISAGLLRMAVESALASMLALPAPVTKVKRIAAPVATVAPTAGEEPEERTPLTREQLAHLSGVRVEHMRVGARAKLVEQGERYNAYTRAQLAAEREVQTTLAAMMRPSLPDQIRGEFAGLPEDARLGLLRELAESMGMRLSRAPARAAA